MKKIFFTLVLLISAFCCIFGLTACDSSVKEVVTDCIFDSDSMRLPARFTKAYSGGHYVYFIPSEDCTLEGIKNDVEAMSGNGVNYNCEIYNEEFLFIEKLKENEIHYYLVIRTNVYYYFISPTVIMQSVNTEAVLFPYHLTDITAEEFESQYDSVIDGALRLSGTREQVKDFYAKIDMFDITEESNALKIKLKEGYERPERRGSYFHTEKQFTITFGEDDEGGYAVYTLAEE